MKSLFLSDFNQNRSAFKHFINNSKHYEYLSGGGRVVPWRRTDWRLDTTRLVVSFLNCIESVTKKNKEAMKDEKYEKKLRRGDERRRLLNEGVTE